MGGVMDICLRRSGADVGIRPYGFYSGWVGNVGDGVLDVPLPNTKKAGHQALLFYRLLNSFSPR